MPDDKTTVEEIVFAPQYAPRFKGAAMVGYDEIPFGAESQAGPSALGECDEIPLADEAT